MIKYMFVIYDNVAELYSSPFFNVRQEAAIRDVLRAALSDESEIFHAPKDYDLYLIGEYDDETGIVTANAEKEFITNAYVLKLQHEGNQE